MDGRISPQYGSRHSLNKVHMSPRSSLTIYDRTLGIESPWFKKEDLKKGGICRYIPFLISLSIVESFFWPNDLTFPLQRFRFNFVCHFRIPAFAISTSYELYTRLLGCNA
ncbi:hypothetical protein CEXT_195371 [Caerostris extrusa]|uniref:Uncharacterized protein n=1 Tax=Caerostris extrusa TaxID=172846 RepID=A0AAV4VDB6_CAEEX|nr:hypothetical protein CEXT_195371 [Caerostris extrusa]